MGKKMNMSGWYSVEIVKKSKRGSESTAFYVELILDVGHGRQVYEIRIDPNDIEIHQTRSWLLGGRWGTPPQDFDWIPKYLLRPNKIGKELFRIHPNIISKLWGLVASKAKMKNLKGVPSPYLVKVKL